MKEINTEDTVRFILKTHVAPEPAGGISKVMAPRPLQKWTENWHHLKVFEDKLSFGSTII